MGAQHRSMRPSDNTVRIVATGWSLNGPGGVKRRLRVPGKRPEAWRMAVLRTVPSLLEDREEKGWSFRLLRN